MKSGYTTYLCLNLLFSLALLGCREDEPVDAGTPAPPLELPDVSGLDMNSAVADALTLVLQADLRAPWAAFQATLDDAYPDCPDIYLGSTEDADIVEGYTWKDSCTTPGTISYDGSLYWQSDAWTEREDDNTSISTGSRRLEGTARVDQGGTHLFGWSGSAQDSVYESLGEDYAHWTYSSTLEATVTGADVFGDDSPYPGGWRADLYLYYAGGDQNLLEARGDIYLLADTFDRFDSVELDITLQGSLGAAPDACTIEPEGWIGLRDPSGYWYEVIFLPSDADTTNAAGGTCDGCGTWYLRGVEQEGLVCVSFESLWDQLSAPALADYVPTQRY